MRSTCDSKYSLACSPRSKMTQNNPLDSVKTHKKIFIRKIRSAISHFSHIVSKFRIYASVYGNPEIFIGSNCSFGKSIRLAATDGGSISIGRRTHVGDYVQIIARSGRVTIGDDVLIGPGSIIVSMDEIFIGRDTLVAEYVVIRDQDHDKSSRPVRKSGFQTSPIHIGQDVWIGCKASILRGATVGDRSVIGAHALVRTRIPAEALAVGVPAHTVQRDAPCSKAER